MRCLDLKIHSHYSVKEACMKRLEDGLWSYVAVKEYNYIDRKTKPIVNFIWNASFKYKVK